MSPRRIEPLALCVVGEDRGHWDVVRALTDARIRERVAWVAELSEYELDGERSELHAARTWIRRSDAQPWFASKEIRPRTPGRIDPRLHGRRHGPATLVLRRALVYVEDDVKTARIPEPDVVFFAMDVDGEPERVIALKGELEERPRRFAVVLALPDPEIEAWLVALFASRNEEDSARLDALRRDLGTDPTRAPHRLLSTTRASPRDAKRVHRQLFGGVPLHASLERISLSALSPAHEGCGLCEFVAALDATIVTAL